MNEKNITLIIKQKNNTRKLVIGISTAIVLVTALTGCSKESELLKMINQGDMIEIEIAVPENSTETNEELLAWIILASLTSQQELRNQWDDTLKITLTADGKNGCLYVDATGNNENNNTLRVALHNRAFLTMLEDKNTLEALAQAAELAFTDIDSEDNQDKALMMALNAYFNMLPDEEGGACNADDALSRKEFMTMVARGEMQVDETLVASTSFDGAVGSSKFNAFAEQVADSSYLDLGTKSLNNKTYNGTMSRGEAIYLIVNRYFGNELANYTESKDIKFSDCKDGGYIAKAQKFIEDANEKDYCRDYEMVYATQNPDDGAPTDIYRALVVAKKHGIVGENTRWDEGITKYEAIKLLVEAYKQESGVEMFNFASGKNGEHTEVVAETPKKDPADKEVSVEWEDHTEIDEDEQAAIDDEKDGTQDEGEFKVTEMSKTMWAKQDCNTRKGPSADYTKEGSLAFAEEVKVTGYCEEEGWYRIEKNGKEMFVSGKFLQDTKVNKPSGGNNGGNYADPSNPNVDYGSGCCEDTGNGCYTDLTSIPIEVW